MLLNVTLTGDRELIARLEKMPAAVQAALALKVTALALKLEAWVKTKKLNGQVLNRITGRLARSIANKVTTSSDAVIAKIFSSGDVKYAGIHEFGGKTMPHVIVPKKAQALHFGGKFYAKVNHPGSNMPVRSFLRSSLREMSTEISLGMKEAVVRAAQKSVDG